MLKKHGLFYAYTYFNNKIVLTLYNPLNQKTSYKYNEIGNLIEETDSNGNTTKYAYDNLGRVVSRTLPLGQKESYKYDNNGNLIEVTDFNGKVTKYEYNSNNQMSKKAE